MRWIWADDEDRANYDKYFLEMIISNRYELTIVDFDRLMTGGPLDANNYIGSIMPLPNCGLLWGDSKSLNRAYNSSFVRAEMQIKDYNTGIVFIRYEGKPFMLIIGVPTTSDQSERTGPQMYRLYYASRIEGKVAEFAEKLIKVTTNSSGNDQRPTVPLMIGY